MCYVGVMVYDGEIMSDREIRFWNLFYFFSVNGVSILDMRVMLLRYACQMSNREVARLEKVSYQRVDQRVQKSHRIIKASRSLDRFV